MVSNNGNKIFQCLLILIYITKNNIDYPFAVINMFQKGLNTTTEKKVVSTHPSFKEITILIAQKSEIIASPFKR